MSVMSRATMRWALIALLATAVSAGGGHQGQSSDYHFVTFNGHRDGEVAVESYLNLGLYIPPGPYGGPFFEDAGGLSFLLHTPPNLLSLSPLAPLGVPGQVHASTGTYDFRFVDHTNKFAASATDEVHVLLVFADAGTYVMTGYDVQGEVVGEATHTRTIMNLFEWDALSLEAPGIHRVTLTTPGENTLGALVDTLIFTPVPEVVHAPMAIEVHGPRRNIVNRSAPFVTITILSEDGFDPRRIDPLKVLAGGIGPAQYGYIDRNSDQVSDLFLLFQTRRLNLAGRDVLTVTAVEHDGTPYRATQEVLVTGRRSTFPGG